MNMYPCKIMEKVSFDCKNGKFWDKLETVVTKDGKTIVYPWKLKQLTKEEEEEEKERTKINYLSQEEEKLRAERMIGVLETSKWCQIQAEVAEMPNGFLGMTLKAIVGGRILPYFKWRSWSMELWNHKMVELWDSSKVREKRKAKDEGAKFLAGPYGEMKRRQVAPVNAVRMRSNQRSCNECGSTLINLKPYLSLSLRPSTGSGREIIWP
ncbi:hypothetical protein Tco_0060826 [Tanacetum coccineum]